MALVCGILEKYQHGPLKRNGFSWPLARLKLTEAGLVGYCPIFFGLGAIRVRYDEIEEAVVEQGLFRRDRGATVQLRMTNSHRGDVVIGTANDRYHEILRALRDNGVAVRTEWRA